MERISGVCNWTSGLASRSQDDESRSVASVYSPRRMQALTSCRLGSGDLPCKLRSLARSALTVRHCLGVDITSPMGCKSGKTRFVTFEIEMLLHQGCCRCGWRVLPFLASLLLLLFSLLFLFNFFIFLGLSFLPPFVKPGQIAASYWDNAISL